MCPSSNPRSAATALHAGAGFARRVLPALAILCLGMLSPGAQATQYIYTGKVAKVYSLDRTRYGSPVDHFTLQGFTQAGACLTNDGLVAVVLPDDEGGRRQLAVVLMARAMDWTLHVRVNDERTTPGGAGAGGGAVSRAGPPGRPAAYRQH